MGLDPTMRWEMMNIALGNVAIPVGYNVVVATASMFRTLPSQLPSTLARKANKPGSSGGQGNFCKCDPTLYTYQLARMQN